MQIKLLQHSATAGDQAVYRGGEGEAPHGRHMKAYILNLQKESKHIFFCLLSLCIPSVGLCFFGEEL